MGGQGEGLVHGVAQCGPCCLSLNVFTASNGPNFYSITKPGRFFAGGARARAVKSAVS